MSLPLPRDGLTQVTSWAGEAVRRSARCLLLLGYKGDHSEFAPSTCELADAFGLLTFYSREPFPHQVAGSFHHSF